jgi:predicted tellurium resistance membrane protein TerC
MKSARSFQLLSDEEEGEGEAKEGGGLMAAVRTILIADIVMSLDNVIVGDVMLHDILESTPWLHYAAAAVGAVFVVMVGHWLNRRAQAASPAH